MPPEVTESDLLRRIASGDRQAFAQFYDRYARVLFSIAYRVLGNERESEDVVQDTFVQVWDKAAMFDERLGKPAQWVMSMVRNKSIDRLRSQQRQSKLIELATQQAEVIDPPAISSDADILTKEQAQAVQTAMVNLPSDQRQAIELAFFSGLTHHEIAGQLNEPLGTVKARIRRGMLKLRDGLAGRL